MLVTGTHPRRKIIIHRENGTPAMPKTTAPALPEYIDTDFTMRTAASVYRGIVATVGGVQMDGHRLRQCVYALLQVRVPQIYMGKPLPSEGDEDALFVDVWMFVLHSISRNTPDPENVDEFHDPDKWTIPTRPVV